MVGTGVFTTTGYLVRDVGSHPVIMIGWLVGGLTALCGALAYAELVAALPRNGGEYLLLGRIYHPAVGFVAGWTSFVVGFAAPVGGTAMAFGEYLEKVVPGVPPTVSALALVVGTSAVHSLEVRAGGRVQDVFTFGKIGLIVVFVAVGLFSGEPARVAETGGRETLDALFSAELAVGLIFISYAYLGWNAATYVAGELERPTRLPVALLAGTGLVTALYLGLNFVFLAGAPAAELSGSVSIGHDAASHMWGEGAGRIVSAIIAVGLVSTVGALTMTGPRIYEAMGRDYPALAFLARRRPGGGPVFAIGLQAVVAIATVLTATYDQVLEYVGFTLSLMGGLTVAGVFVLRAREPELPRPYRAWGHPLTTSLFIALMLWMAGHAILQKPEVALVGVATLVVGLVLYLVVRPRDGQRMRSEP